MHACAPALNMRRCILRAAFNHQPLVVYPTPRARGIVRVKQRIASSICRVRCCCWLCKWSRAQLTPESLLFFFFFFPVTSMLTFASSSSSLFFVSVSSLDHYLAHGLAHRLRHDASAQPSTEQSTRRPVPRTSRPSQTTLHSLQAEPSSALASAGFSSTPSPLA